MRRVLTVDGRHSSARVCHADSLAGVGIGIVGVGGQEGDTIGSVAAAVVRRWLAAGGPAVDGAFLGLTTAPGPDLRPADDDMTDDPSADHRSSGGQRTTADAGTDHVEADLPAGRRYLRRAADLLTGLETREWPRIQAAATLVADALAAGATIHAFGSGHSHMLAEEAFYRAGGLVRVRPILFEGLMLHASAPLSTALERLPGLATAILDDHSVAAGDLLLIASNSGGNAVITEMAREARARGVGTIAITSLEHATSEAARHRREPRLHELVDVTIDNGGVVGDAAIRVAGLATPVAPTSTVVGAAIVNAIVAEAVERLVRQGFEPDVVTSSNVAGGDAANERHLRAFGGR